MNVQVNFIQTLDLSKYVHAANILTKYNQLGNVKILNNTQTKQHTALTAIIPEYYTYIQTNAELVGYTDDIIDKRVFALNKYLDFFYDNKFDNIFTSQGKFRPTILEEFMYILFKDLIASIKIELQDVDKLFAGPSKAYTNLYFSAKNLKCFIDSPDIGINQKNQDFAIYRPFTISVENQPSVSTFLPVVAIENKTYIDKTMLEGSIATAEKIKAGNPYSLFIMVAEYYDVSLSVDPAYSRIDQIYILRKCKRLVLRSPIYSDVVKILFNDVKAHLYRNWSDLEGKLKTTGTII